MKTNLIMLLLGLLVGGCSPTSAPDNRPASTVSGRYSGGPLTLEFKDGKCFLCQAGKKANAECTYYVKGDWLYVSPNLKDIPKVHCVYKIEGDVLVGHHIEDDTTGERFEEHLAGEFKLKKESP